MFDLETSEDFYAVLVEDFDDFMAERQSARRAVHCAITAYHLHEWVWGDWLKADRVMRAALGINDKNSFLAWIGRHCLWFSCIQDLANGTKHFIRKQSFETARIGGGFGEGPYGIGPFGEGYLLIDFGEEAGNNRFMPAADLLEIVVRFWRDFFRTYRPSPDLPVSKHHAN